MLEYFQYILEQISPDTHITSMQQVGGGCIHNTIRLVTNSQSYFVKYNLAEDASLFETEAKGLQLLSTSSPIRVPKILANGSMQNTSYLLLEWIEKGASNSTFWKDFGQQLARQHQCTQSHFGLDHDNFIGRLPQSNTLHATWDEFFVTERLVPQLELALTNQLIDKDILTRFECLFPQFKNLIPNEPPALLHGDLWSGNFLSDEMHQPVIFDPAVHYGHRETELAFTHLFGGFDRSFYQYYDEVYPLEKGFENRVDLHNLYPLLVHVNLFGRSYLSGILQTLKSYT